MRGKRAEAGRWGQVRRDKEERERKAHKRVDDATPVSGPFLKAVVASQDLGAAGTEFERSVISLTCNKNYHFLHHFYGPPLSSLSMSVHLTLLPSYSPYFHLFFFVWMPRKQLGPIFLLRPMLFQIGVFGGMRNQIQ
jgi:hypothetical protein